MYLLLVVTVCFSVCDSGEQFVGAHFLIILSFGVQLPWICCIFLFFGKLAPSLFNSILSDPDVEQPELWSFTHHRFSQLFPLVVDALFCLTRLFQETSKHLKGPDKNSKLVFVLIQCLFATCCQFSTCYCCRAGKEKLQPRWDWQYSHRPSCK